ncbi:MAG: recombinase RecA [Nocardia sp.]|nr:recombinase RecA [Nocardia sp.]
MSEHAGTPTSSIEGDSADVRELAEIPAVEVISRAAVMLMSSAAEKLGLADDDPDASPRRDLDEARRVITALAGLITSSVEYLGPHAGPLREGLQSLQRAFRESSAHPDAPGAGPGEKYTGPVH